MSTFHHYASGKAPVERPDPKTIEEFHAQAAAFLAKYPIPEDKEKTRRIDDILGRQSRKKTP